MRKGLSKAKLAQVLKHSRKSPADWMNQFLGAKPWGTQRRIIEALRDNKRVAVPSCHASGKSWTVARAALWFLLCHPDSYVLTTAPTHRQVERVVWAEIRSALKSANVYLGGSLPPKATHYTIRNKWEMVGFATDDPDKFQGWHNKHILVIVDEAPGIEHTMWNAIEGVLSSGDARLLCPGNPVEAAGPFWEMCQPGSDVVVIPISAFDTPNFTEFGITQDDIANDTWREKITGPLPHPYLISPEWVAGRYKRWGPRSPMYISRVLGQFPESAKDSLIPLSWAMNAQRRKLLSDGEIVLGVDVARFGDNETVCALRCGPVGRIAWTSSQEDTMQTAARIAHTARKFDVDAIFVDEIGVGGGVVDRLNQLRFPVMGLNSGARAKDSEMFANSRAEWYWRLRVLFEDEKIDIPEDDTELLSQLTSIKYGLTPAGKIQIESKDDMQERGMESPDKADALMLAFAAPHSTGKANPILASSGIRHIGSVDPDEWPDEWDEDEYGRAVSFFG